MLLYVSPASGPGSGKEGRTWRRWRGDRGPGARQKVREGLLFDEVMENIVEEVSGRLLLCLLLLLRGLLIVVGVMVVEGEHLVLGLDTNHSCVCLWVDGCRGGSEKNGLVHMTV